MSRRKSPIARTGASSPFHKRLVDLMDSERLLQQAIAGMLSRLPGIQGVQILHGAQEAGKDVVFKTRGPLGELFSCACVVKNHEISGSVDSNEGARAVLFQVQQVFDTPYYDGAGNEILVQRAYVITPYQIKPQAINSIIGFLRDRAGQVVFFDGPQLLDLFLRHWPDFLADEAMAINTYLHKSSERLQQNSELERVAILYDLSQDGKTIPSTYIELDLTIRLHKLGYQMFLARNRLSAEELDTLVKAAGAESSKVSTIPSSIEEKFISLFDFATYLLKCGFWDKDAAPIGADFPAPIRAMLSSCGVSTAKHRKRRSSYSEVPQESAKRNDIGALVLQCNRELGVWIQKGVLPLRRAIDAQAKVAAALRSELDSPRNLFAFPGIVAAMAVDNCVSTAPWWQSEPETVLDMKCQQGAVINPEFRAILVTGPAGSGKTSFCRWNALRDAKLYLDGESDVVPAYVPLHVIQNHALSDLRDLVACAANRSALIDGSAERLLGAAGPKVRVYLDGLDEVYAEDKRRQFVAIAAQATEDFGNVQIVMTSRDNVPVGIWLNWLPRIFLGALSLDDVRRLAKAWLGTDSAVERFMRNLSLLFEKTEFSWTPLLATLTLMVYRQTAKLPENRPRLYELFTDLLCGGWDLAKGILRQSYFERDAKLRLLSRLAFEVHSRGARYFGFDELVEAVDWSLAGKRVDPQALLAELTRDAIVVRAGDSWQFRHLSFQEFLAARFCVRQPDDTKIREAIKTYIEGQDWWVEVIRFYIGLCGKSRDLLGWINSLDAGIRVKQLYSFLDEAQ